MTSNTNDTDKRKNVKLDVDTHRELKIFSTNTGQTMGEAIIYLIKLSKRRDVKKIIQASNGSKKSTSVFRHLNLPKL